jgi:hypothetical protein
MNLRRTALAVGVLVAGLVAAVGSGMRFRDGLPLDSTAANVVPWVLFGGAVIETMGFPDAEPPGVEGAVLFVRMVDDDSMTVLDRPFDWPSDAQRISPGRYDLTVYWRTCSGNCGQLDGEDRFCERDIAVAAGGRIRVSITSGNLAPGSRCTVAMD